MKKMFYAMCLIILFTFSGLSVNNKTEKININSWLYLGPVEATMIGVENDKDLLNYDFLNIGNLIPVKNEKIRWNNNAVLKWRKLKNKKFKLTRKSVLYFATYLKTNRWLEVNLKINKTNAAFALYINGKRIKSCVVNKDLNAKLKLENEKHLIIIKAVASNGLFDFKSQLYFEKPYDASNIKNIVTPQHRVNIKNILNEVNIMNVNLSRDGRFVKVGLSKTDDKTGKIQKWIEILSTKDGKMIFNSKNIGMINGFKWLKSDKKFSFTKSKDNKTSVFIYNLKNRTQRLLIKDIKDFTQYWWSPENDYFIYSTIKLFGNNKIYKNIIDLPSRTKSSGYKTALKIVYINKSKGGLNSVKRNFANYTENYQDIAISPDGKKILLIKITEDYKHRPYTKFNFSVFDIATSKKLPILSSYWLNGVKWSPDSRKLLFIGGPSSFKGIGNNLSKNIIPNDFDNQMYIYDLKTKNVVAVSKSFTPSVDANFWEKGNMIYLKATKESFKKLYRYNIGNRRYKEINTRVDVVNVVDFSRRIAVYSGSSTIKAQKLFKLKLSTGSVSVLKDYNKNSFENVRFGKCKDFDFISSENRKIKGRLYFPPDFDASKKYPCIIYYYGGTMPVTREFGGRYPKNWYAANGYIVYVLQPTGAVGFGQKPSSAHINDWGKITSKEIIEAVDKLIENHNYIDSQKIGSMGASYGGFLTQYLATQTDKISAFISHAGISALSSYWGVGDWGYSYSGIASADSFPWNRKDLYVGHSPLFMADRVKKPLLLLHGDADNNVPVGESYQMFAALKLAGKEVALITFKGQQHFILEYKKRVRWMRTIIAWFDRWLKDEPEHWENMYGGKN